MIDPRTASPLDLADLHLEALYETDDAGRIVASRDPDLDPPRGSISYEPLRAIARSWRRASPTRRWSAYARF